MIKKICRSFGVAALVLLSCTMHAERRMVSGTITDTPGSPMRGVNELINGTTTETAAFANGNFSLDAVSTGVLVIHSSVLKHSAIRQNRSTWYFTSYSGKNSDSFKREQTQGSLAF